MKRMLFFISFLFLSPCYALVRRCNEALLRVGHSMGDKLRFADSLDGTKISVWSENFPDGWVSVIEYEFDSPTKILWIKDSATVTLYNMDGSPRVDFKRKGLYSELRNELLQKFPDTQYMASSLMHTNRTFYFDALNSGMTPEEAIKSTPTYKSAAKLGFTKIVIDKGERQRSELPQDKEDRGQRIFLFLKKE